MMGNEWQLESSEEWPGILDPGLIVTILDILDNDSNQGLLPLYSGENRTKPAVDDDSVTLDTLCKQFNRELFELLTSFKKLLEVFSDKILPLAEASPR